MPDNRLRVELTGDEKIIASVAKINASLAHFEEHVAKAAVAGKTASDASAKSLNEYARATDLFNKAIQAIAKGDGVGAKAFRTQAIAAQQSASQLRRLAIEQATILGQIAEHANRARKAALDEAKARGDVAKASRDTIRAANAMQDEYDKVHKSLLKSVEHLKEIAKSTDEVAKNSRAAFRDADKSIFKTVANDADRAEKNVRKVKRAVEELSSIKLSNLSAEDLQRVNLGLKPKRTFGQLEGQKIKRGDVEFTPDAQPGERTKGVSAFENLSSANLRRVTMGLKPKQEFQDPVDARTPGGLLGRIVNPNARQPLIPKDTDDELKKVDRTLERFAPKVVGLTLATRAMYSAFEATTHALSEMTIGSAKYAARAEQLQYALDAVAKSGSVSTIEANAVVDALRKMNVTTVEAREQTARLIATNINHAKALQLARAAQNLGRVANLTTAESFERLTHAIITGQPELLRLLGLNVSFESAYRKAAQALKTNVESLDSYQRANIRVNATLEAASRYNGAYEASNQSVGGRLLQVKRHVDELKLAIGDRLLPVLQVATDALIAFLQNTRKLAEFQMPGDFGFKDFMFYVRDIFNTDMPNYGLGFNQKEFQEFQKKRRQAYLESLKNPLDSVDLPRDRFNSRATADLNERMRLEEEYKSLREQDAQAIAKKGLEAELRSKELLLQARSVEVGGIAGARERRDRTLQQMREFVDKHGRLKEVPLTPDTVANVNKAMEAEIRKEREKTHDQITKLNQQAANQELELQMATVRQSSDIRLAALERDAALEVKSVRDVEEERLAIIKQSARDEALVRKAQIESKAEVEIKELMRDEKRKGTDKRDIDVMIGHIKSRTRKETEALEVQTSANASIAETKLAGDRGARELQAARDLHKAKQDSEIQALMYANNRIDAIKQKELDSLESVVSQSLGAKMFVEKRKGEIEIDALRTRAENEKKILEATTKARLLEFEITAKKLGLSDTATSAMAAQIKADSEAARKEIETSLAEGVDAASRRVSLDQARIYRDSTLQTFASIKSSANNVFDALTRRSQTFGQALANAIKTPILTALKEIVTSQIATRFTKLLTGQTIKFEQSGMYRQSGAGGLLQKLGFGTLPILASPQMPVIPAYTPPFVQNQQAAPMGQPSMITKNLTRGLHDWMGASNPMAYGSEGRPTAGGGGFAMGGGLSQVGMMAMMKPSMLGIGTKTAPPVLASSGLPPGVMPIPGHIGIGMDQMGNVVPLASVKSVPFPKSGLGTSTAGQIGSGAMVAGGGMLASWGLNRGGWTGMAASALGGAAIGFAFGGPIGAAIGAGIGAAAGVVRMFVKTSEEQMIQQVKRRYGVTISKEFAKGLVQIARQKYAGSFSVAIQSKEVREMLELYAFSTGQKFNAGTTPRPYSFAQYGSQISENPYYRFGVEQSPSTVDFSPLSSGGGRQSISIQLNEAQTQTFLSGQMTETITNNPKAVQSSALSAQQSNYGRMSGAAMMLSPNLARG